jgi:thymidine kinase
VALLRFSFGTMGSGKSTVALQIHHNLASRGLRGLLLTRLDRDGTQVTSRLGVAAPAVEVGDEVDLFALAVARAPLDYLVCDEAQFYAPEQCDQLARIVDELDADVYAFGLITDFRGLLFEGTKRLLEVADERVPIQVEARCWCGARATHNARLVNGPGVLRRRRPGGRHGGRRRSALRDASATSSLSPPLPRWHARLSATQAQGMR